MSISISEINLYSEVHREIVMKLCNRNNFHEGDVYMELYKDFPREHKNQIIELIGKSEYDKRTKKFIEERFIGLESSGYFITIEKASKKKVVGFIMYNVEEMTKKSDLLFILIDKNYQNNGFGTKLVDKYIEVIIQKKLLYATVKVENKIVYNFYKKFGFDKHEDLIKSEKGIYEYLHYIPSYSLQALNIIKKIIQ